MQKDKQKIKKATRSFNPDVVATAVHQAIERDFREAQHVYCLNDDVTLYAFNRQVNELLKKFTPSTVDPKTLDDKTYAKFAAVNLHMSAVREKLVTSFPVPGSKISRAMSDVDKIHIRARSLMHNVLSSFTVDEWFTECKNSVGSSLGVPYMDTSPEQKFTLPMTGTKYAIELFTQYLRWDNSLLNAIQEMNNLPVQTCQNFDAWFTVIESSRATTVPKNASINRFIAIEGTCNMFLQQGLMMMMYKRMKKVGLDVAILPELHKKLAMWSSITMQNATLDWSSASDCGSTELYGWLIPPRWFRYCSLTRTTSTEISGEKVELNMFSTMGNAVTFPLETLVFWTYAVAVLFTAENPGTNSVFPSWECQKRCSVFGDDCIVPTLIATQYMEVMTGVGFLINEEKSFFADEQFRESCGGDYLAGYDVRPFSLKAPQTVKQSALEPWLYIIGNALLKKYIQYFGELAYVYDKAFWHVLFGLFSKHKIKIKLVPCYFPDDAGLKITADLLRFQLNYPFLLNEVASSQHGTYSFNYMRFVYRKRVIRDEALLFNLWLKKPKAGEARRITSQTGEDWDGSESPVVHERLQRDRKSVV